MELAQILTLAQIVAIIGSAAVSIYVYVRMADRKMIDAVSAQLPPIRERAADMHTRLSILETTVRHMPTHADLAGIQRELRELNGEVAALGERSETTLSMVRSIQEHLMEGR